MAIRPYTGPYQRQMYYASTNSIESCQLLFAVRITRTETFSFKMSSQSFRIQLSGQIAKIVVLLHLIIIPWLVDPMLSQVYFLISFYQISCFGICCSYFDLLLWVKLMRLILQCLQQRQCRSILRYPWRITISPKFAIQENNILPSLIVLYATGCNGSSSE